MSRMTNNIVDLEGRPLESREQTLEMLYRQYSSPLRAFLRLRLNADEDHEDLLQEIFLRLAKMPGLANKMHNGVHNKQAYLFSIANNVIIDLLRHKAVRRPYDAGQLEHMPDVEMPIGPEIIASADEELAHAKKKIMALSPRVQKAFVLSRFKHMSYRQIAAEMNVPVKRVEKYIAKALSKLRDGREAG